MGKLSFNHTLFIVALNRQRQHYGVAALTCLSAQQQWHVVSTALAEQLVRAPLDYPRQSMATITTYDLPTLRGFWQNVDLLLGKELGLYPDERTLQQQIEQRDNAKQGLFDALHQYKLLLQRVGRNTIAARRAQYGVNRDGHATEP
ncbi:MAG: hypothetical protein ACR5LF_02010 [Symbiopectobacterium sp.]